MLNEEEIRFYTYTKINEEGSESLYLTYPSKEKESSHLNLIYGTVKADEVIPPTDEKDYKIQVKIQDEVKAKLAINKTDTAGQALKNVKFRLTGEGKDGEILTTDKNGNMKRIYTVDGLHLNKIGYKAVASKLTKYLNE